MPILQKVHAEISFRLADIFFFEKNEIADSLPNGNVFNLIRGMIAPLALHVKKYLA